MYINKVLIYGNVTRDPELRSTPGGLTVASFSIATNRVYKDKAGAKQEEVQFHNIVVFGKQADIIAQYVKKGSALFVEGRLQTRSWDGQDGKKNYRTEIVADRVQFGPRREGGALASPAQAFQGAPSAREEQQPAPGVIEYPEESINPEDIPF